MEMVEGKVARKDFSCHITGEDINLAEPYLAINNTISVKFRKDKLNEVKNFFIKLKEKRFS